MSTRKRAGTDYPIHFLMVSSVEHTTGLTGLTPTVTISKNGAAFGGAAGAVSEIGNGWYAQAGHATDRETLGELLIHATATGADPVDFKVDITAQDQFATNFGMLNVSANIEQISDDATAAQNAEAFFDGTGYAGTNNVIPTVTTVDTCTTNTDMRGTNDALLATSYTAPDNTNIANIVADTNELQTDWHDGGRLDLILDARASQTSVDTVDGNVDAILLDTGTDGVIVATNNDKTGYSLTVTPPTAAAIRTEMDSNSTKLANLDVVLSTRATPADVNAQVLDVLTVDTFAQPGQEAPAATTTLMNMLRYLYKVFRNKQTFNKDTGVYNLYADNGTTVDQKQTSTDDDTTFTRGELESGA
jgi:hypothetical protein